MAHNSGPTKRDMFQSHGAGKGSGDRSPGWREHYDEIAWTRAYDTGPDGDKAVPAGFIEVAPKHYRKSYGEPANQPSAPTRDWRTGPEPIPVPAIGAPPEDWRKFVASVETNSF